MGGSKLDANTYLKWITFKCKSTIDLGRFKASAAAAASLECNSTSNPLGHLLSYGANRSGSAGMAVADIPRETMAGQSAACTCAAQARIHRGAAGGGKGGTQDYGLPPTLTRGQQAVTPTRIGARIAMDRSRFCRRRYWPRRACKAMQY